MSAIKDVRVTSEMQRYVLEAMVPLTDRHRRALDRTGALTPYTHLRIAPEQGRFLTMLTLLTGARHAVEVGTFTGYSALCIADGLAPGGDLLCSELNSEWAAIAQEVWAEAGVADRVNVVVGPALDTLRALPHDPALDLAFIDADKAGYWDYYNELLPRIRRGGLVVVDNVLYEGKVVDETADGPAGDIREFNQMLATDQRVDLAVVTMSDGMTLARKR